MRINTAGALETLLQDARYALRWLARSPAFSLVAILSLGVGIGFNTAIFAVADALLLRPLAVREPGRLVDLYTSGVDGDAYSTNSLPDLLDYRGERSVFDDVGGYSPMFAAVSRGDRARLVLGEIVTGNFLSMLGVRARLGRTLLPEDDAPAAPAAVVLSQRYWLRDFGGDPGVVGQSLKIRGQQFTIVGVLDGRFTGTVPMLAPELWIPARFVEEVEPAGINETVPSPTGTSRLDRRGQRWLFAKARLAPGISLDQARAGVEVMAARLRAEHPQTNGTRRVTLRRSLDTRLHPEADRVVAWLVTGTMLAVGLVLVIACANVAGMLLARASARQREIGIRLAVGAARTRVIRQLLTESVILGALGAAVGVLIAVWLTRLLTTFELPFPVALTLDLRLDARVLAFTAAVAMLTGVVAGLAPALRATRANLVSDLKGDATAGRRSRWWSPRDVLVIGQMAVTIVLLVSAGLLTRSLAAAGRADVGFPTEGLAIVAADTGMLRYSPERSRQYWTEVTRRVSALPGVRGVALASRLPFSINFNRTNIAVPGHQKTADEMGASINSAVVSSSYFETLRIAVAEGRSFAETDTPGARRVAIVSEAMARAYWPNETAVGRVVFERTLNSGRPFEIVGVVANHKLQTVGERPLPAIYFPASQRPSAYNVLVARTDGDDGALVAAMRDTLLALEPDLLLLETVTMNQQVQATLLPIRIAARLVMVFGVVGLALAAVGLYGIIAFSVAQRTREIGIRIAIGASSTNVVTLVLRHGLGLAIGGLAAGSLMALAATRLVSGALYSVSSADPIAWGGATAILFATALLAHAIPVYRAVRIDPVASLREGL